MGKIDKLGSQQIHDETTSSSGIFCERCSRGLSRFASQFDYKCVLVLILSVSVFLSALFLLFRSRPVNLGFDASQKVKMEATVQAYFRLERPVVQLVPYIVQLEDELYVEIGVPDTKVAILSMHQSGASNWTDVSFGILPDPINDPMNPVSLSLLKSSLIDLFQRQSNLTLTQSIFGQPSSFELLKFIGGITVIPVQSASIWQMPKMLFNFTLNNSISDIQENLAELKQQLKFGLRLRSNENVYVQVTNEVGSTETPPVTVQATVLSALGSLVPHRLKQLAETIQSSSRSKNLGLNNTLFGKVKSVSLSSYLEYTLHAVSPAPSPYPFPKSPVPSSTWFSSYPPASSPDCSHLSPSSTYDASPPSNSHDADAPSSKSLSPAPLTGTATSSPHPHRHPQSRPTYSRPGQLAAPAFPPHITTRPTHKGSGAPMISSAARSLSPFYHSMGLGLLIFITLTFCLKIWSC
ncbi:hypothetical protein Nepgr_025775 [Nepenthes gracilis]|uniref:DUF7036 domain-containing protein n=1 Tax=Nepenthes gracilis TaxID=150966 RepID=A0AAD3T760_NEPGR|nr:hypothetical protein Nepgr_025775 [Nepenthes gracilis]